MSHSYIPFSSALLYLMGSLLLHILTRTDSYLSFFVTRRLVFTRCISQARQQYWCTSSVVILSLDTLLKSRVITCTSPYQRSWLGVGFYHDYDHSRPSSDERTLLPQSVKGSTSLRFLNLGQ